MNDPLEVGSLSRWSDVATPILPITGRHSLAPASSARYPNSGVLQRRLPHRGEISGLPCSASVTRVG